MRVPGVLQGSAPEPARSLGYTRNAGSHRLPHGEPADACELVERFMPKRFLDGILPTALVNSYRVFREERRPLSAASKHAAEALDATGATVMLRGYPIKKQDRANRHVLLINVQERPLHAFGGVSRAAATIHKHFLEPIETDKYLLNLLAPSEDLQSLLKVMVRLDALAHILVWSECELTPEGPVFGSTYRIDLVELPRLRLSFRCRESSGGLSRQERSEEVLSLRSIELPHLRVYRPAGGVWPADLLGLTEGVPHGVLMISETQELLLLVPNVKLRIFEGRLEPARDAPEWDRNVATNYFTYEVHVSRCVGSFSTPRPLRSALPCLVVCAISAFAHPPRGRRVETLALAASSC